MKRWYCWRATAAESSGSEVVHSSPWISLSQGPGEHPGLSPRHMLRDATDYRDLGAHYFDRRDKRRVAARLVLRLNQLGYAVELRSAA